MVPNFVCYSDCENWILALYFFPLMKTYFLRNVKMSLLTYQLKFSKLNTREAKSTFVINRHVDKVTKEQICTCDTVEYVMCVIVMGQTNPNRIFGLRMLFRVSNGLNLNAPMKFFQKALISKSFKNYIFSDISSLCFAYPIHHYTSA